MLFVDLRRPRGGLLARHVLSLCYADSLARIFPFQPYRYTPQAGPIEKLVTQPYDKISPAMQERYLSQSPYNLVRVILGQRFQNDTDTDNGYTRAQRHLQAWIESGILARDPQPCL